MAFSSCRKENGIDNNKVLLTPYGVYFADNLGYLTNTNDGLSYRSIKNGGGKPIRAIAVSGKNIIFITNKGAGVASSDLFVSVDNGVAFNGGKGVSVNPVALWASQILDVPGDKVYVTSTKPNSVEVSTDNGVTWTSDAASFPGSITGASIGSFAQLPSGEVFGLDPSGANLYFVRKGQQWTQVSTATGLPNGKWYLTNFNATLVAADYNGTAIYYSDDKGLNWIKYSGIPGNQQIFSCVAPLGQTLLAGTDSSGVYRLSGGAFVPSNNGLQPFTSVYGISGKQDTYKNGIIKRYVYIATNRGLYRSEDLGQNWVLMMPGDFRTIW